MYISFAEKYPNSKFIKLALQYHNDADSAINTIQTLLSNYHKTEKNIIMNNKVTAPSSTITRDLRDLDRTTDNIYESVVVVSKRSNQIAANIKDELQQKLSEFSSSNDTLEEIFENREQIEISKRYERMPKPTLVAIDEFLNGKVYHRNPAKEQTT